LFRGKKAAGIDVAGAAIGALGLLVFALLNRRFFYGDLAGRFSTALADSKADVAPTDRKPKIPAWHPNIL
jgi:hypothetical protein